MSDLTLIESVDLSDRYLHNPYGNDTEYRGNGYAFGETEPSGWYFGSGNPEFWRHSDKLLVPGGKLLDVGSGEGRSSMFFVLNGMQVTAVDPEVSKTEEFSRAINELGYEIEVINNRVEDAPLQPNTFDTVLLDHTFAHLDSFGQADAILVKTWAVLKPGGHLWMRANGTEDSRYWEMCREASRGFRFNNFGGASGSEMKIVEDGIIEHPCNCSGEIRLDKSVFFEQLDIPLRIARLGGLVEHLQCIPREGEHNMMYGEDFNRELGGVYLGGTISLIARKPE